MFTSSPLIVAHFWDAFLISLCIRVPRYFISCRGKNMLDLLDPPNFLLCLYYAFATCYYKYMAIMWNSCYVPSIQKSYLTVTLTLVFLDFLQLVSKDIHLSHILMTTEASLLIRSCIKFFMMHTHTHLLPKSCT